MTVRALLKKYIMALTLLLVSPLVGEEAESVVLEKDKLSLAGLEGIDRPLKFIFSNERLDVGISYSALFQAAIGHGETAGSGELRIGGRLIFVDEKYPSRLLESLGVENDGLFSLKFAVRHRHALLDLSAAELSPTVGSFLGSTDGFSDRGFEIPELYLQQVFSDGRIELRYGQLSVEDRLDGHAMRSAQKAFLNRVFSTNPTVAFPRFGAGSTIRWQVNDKLDVTYALTQVQASKTGAQVDFELSSGQLFTGLQTGYTWDGQNEIDYRLQFLGWAADGTDEATEDFGFSFGYEMHSEENSKSLFSRFSYSTGQQTDLDRMATIGVGENRRENDLLGIAVGAGRSSLSPDYQGVIEVFYRYQTNFGLQLTPDIQLHVGDGVRKGFALIPGLRGRMDF